jgi:molybdopterin-guanine dinucleotide biosynthesis protein B
VHRPALDKPALYIDDATIVAVVSDVARPATLRAGVAWLDLNDIGKVLAWVGKWVSANPQVLPGGVVKD